MRRRRGEACLAHCRITIVRGSTLNNSCGKQQLYYVSCLLLVVLTACTPGVTLAPTPTVAVDLETEEYGVYAAAVAELGGGIIRERTADLDYITRGGSINTQLDFSHSVLAVTTAIADDFMSKNRTAVDLEKKLDLQFDTFITEAEHQAVFDRDLQKGWERFHQQYGYQLLTLSRPGFNPEMNRALIYAEYGRGALDAVFFYMVASKISGRWTVQQKLMSGGA